MEKNSKTDKNEIGSKKSTPSRFETKIIKIGSIRSELLPFLDEKTYSNLIRTNKNISNKIFNEQALISNKMYLIYMNCLVTWSLSIRYKSSNIKLIFEDLASNILDSDFTSLCNLLQRKQAADQKKFYFDAYTKKINPVFSLYLKMHMIKIILLELLSITKEDFDKYEICYDAKNQNDNDEDWLKQTILNNMTENSQEKRVNKIFDIIVKEQEFEVKTFWDEMKNDERYNKLLADRKNQGQDVLYIHLLDLWIIDNIGIDGQLKDDSIAKLAIDTIRSFSEQKTMNEIMNHHHYDYMLNHPEGYDSVCEELVFGNRFSVNNLIDYILSHSDHENFGVAILLAGIIKRKNELNGKKYPSYADRVPLNTSNYNLVCSLLSDKKCWELGELGMYILDLIFFLLYLPIAIICFLKILSISVTIGCLSVLPLLTIICLLALISGKLVENYFIPWMGKLICDYDAEDKKLIDNAEKIINTIRDELKQNKIAYKDKLDKQKEFFNKRLANYQEQNNHKQNLNQPVTETENETQNTSRI